MRTKDVFEKLEFLEQKDLELKKQMQNEIRKQFTFLSEIDSILTSFNLK